MMKKGSTAGNYDAENRRKKLKMEQRQCSIEDIREKKMQSEITLGYTKQTHGWLTCSSDSMKTEAIFNILEQLVDKRASKKRQKYGGDR